MKVEMRRRPADAGRRSIVSAATAESLALEVLLRLVAALVARLRLQVRIHVVLRDEEQTRVRVRRRHEAAGELVEEELDDRLEALQVGLLVDREVQVAALDVVEDDR